MVISNRCRPSVVERVPTASPTPEDIGTWRVFDQGTKTEQHDPPDDYDLLRSPTSPSSPSKSSHGVAGGVWGAYTRDQDSPTQPWNAPIEGEAAAAATAAVGVPSSEDMQGDDDRGSSQEDAVTSVASALADSPLFPPADQESAVQGLPLGMGWPSKYTNVDEWVEEFQTNDASAPGTRSSSASSSFKPPTRRKNSSSSSNVKLEKRHGVDIQRIAVIFDDGARHYQELAIDHDDSPRKVKAQNGFSGTSMTLRLPRVTTATVRIVIEHPQQLALSEVMFWCAHSFSDNHHNSNPLHALSSKKREQQARHTDPEEQEATNFGTGIAAAGYGEGNTYNNAIPTAYSRHLSTSDDGLVNAAAHTASGMLHNLSTLEGQKRKQRKINTGSSTGSNQSNTSMTGDGHESSSEHYVFGLPYGFRKRLANKTSLYHSINASSKDDEASKAREVFGKPYGFEPSDDPRNPSGGETASKPGSPGRNGIDVTDPIMGSEYFTGQDRDRRIRGDQAASEGIASNGYSDATGQWTFHSDHKAFGLPYGYSTPAPTTPAPSFQMFNSSTLPQPQPLRIPMLHHARKAGKAKGKRGVAFGRAYGWHVLWHQVAPFSLVSLSLSAPCLSFSR